METVRFPFVKIKILVKHSEAPELVESSGAF